MSILRSAHSADLRMDIVPYRVMTLKNGADFVQFVTTNWTKSSLEVELQPELDSAWIIRRGEAGELTWRYRRITFDADIRKPQRIEDEGIGYGVHFLEVGPVEQIEGVEDELDPERAVSV